MHRVGGGDYSVRGGKYRVGTNVHVERNLLAQLVYADAFDLFQDHVGIKAKHDAVLGSDKCHAIRTGVSELSVSDDHAKRDGDTGSLWIPGAGAEVASSAAAEVITTACSRRR